MTGTTRVSRPPSAGTGSDPGASLAWLLAGLALLRIGAALAPPGLVWGVDAAGRVHPALGVVLLALGLAGALVALAGKPRPLAVPEAPWRGWPLALAAALTLLLVAFPDRVRFVGDFVLRLGILESARGFERIFPQALALDSLVNHTLPVRLGAAVNVEPLLVLRAMGVLELWILVALAVRFARLVTTRDGHALVVASVMCCGGLATLFTGYSKPTPELALCALATATLGVEQMLAGSGRVPFALAVAAGLALHRGGLPLLLPWAVVGAATLRRDGLGAGGWPERALHAAALLLPLAVLVVEAKSLAAVITSFDVPVNFTPGEVRAQGGMLAAAFAPVRLLDDANAVLLHAPLAPLVLLALPAGSAAWRSPARWALASVALAFLPVLLFVHLPLGPFRDYDSLGGIGAAAAVASAWAVARVLERSARAPWLGAGVVSGALAAFLALLLSLTDLPRAYARAEAIVAGPPARSATQRASVLDWIALRSLNENDYERARDAYMRLCIETPIPHALKLWGAAALISDHPAEAQRAFAQLLGGAPSDPVGWVGLWLSASEAGDTLAAARAEAHTRAWATDSREMSEVVEFFDHYPRLYGILQRRLPPRPVR